MAKRLCWQMRAISRRFESKVGDFRSFKTTARAIRPALPYDQIARKSGLSHPEKKFHARALI
jgi:hypothetical protein